MKLRLMLLTSSALLVANSSLATEVTAYGQVNKMVMMVDNGVDKTTHIADNDVSATRFGFKAQQQLDNGMTVSGLLELQSESNSSSKIAAVSNEQNESNSSISERHSRIGLGTKYGTFMIGKTSEATDGISEIDLGGVQDMMTSDSTLIGGSLALYRKGTNNLEGFVGQMYNNLDGIRTNLVRYDSPVVNNLQASTSYTSGGDVAIAVRHETTLDKIKLKSGFGYTKYHSVERQGISYSPNPNIDVYDSALSGSVSAIYEPTGVALTLAAGKLKYVDGYSNSAFRTVDDGNFVYTKLSYLPVDSNFEYAVDYSQARNMAVGDHNEQLKTYSAGVQYNLAQGVSLSSMYKEMKTDVPHAGYDLEKISILTAGLKVKF